MTSWQVIEILGLQCKKKLPGNRRAEILAEKFSLASREKKP